MVNVDCFLVPLQFHFSGGVEGRQMFSIPALCDWLDWTNDVRVNASLCVSLWTIMMLDWKHFPIFMEWVAGGIRLVKPTRNINNMNLTVWFNSEPAHTKLRDPSTVLITLI